MEGINIKEFPEWFIKTEDRLGKKLPPIYKSNIHLSYFFSTSELDLADQPHENNTFRKARQQDILEKVEKLGNIVPKEILASLKQDTLLPIWELAIHKAQLDCFKDDEENLVNYIYETDETSTNNETKKKMNPVVDIGLNNTLSFPSVAEGEADFTKNAFEKLKSAVPLATPSKETPNATDEIDSNTTNTQNIDLKLSEATELSNKTKELIDIVNHIKDEFIEAKEELEIEVKFKNELLYETDEGEKWYDTLSPEDYKKEKKRVLEIKQQQQLKLEHRFKKTIQSLSSLFNDIEKNIKRIKEIHQSEDIQSIRLDWLNELTIALENEAILEEEDKEKKSIQNAHIEFLKEAIATSIQVAWPMLIYNLMDKIVEDPTKNSPGLAVKVQGKSHFHVSYLTGLMFMFRKDVAHKLIDHYLPQKITPHIKKISNFIPFAGMGYVLAKTPSIGTVMGIITLLNLGIFIRHQNILPTLSLYTDDNKFYTNKVEKKENTTIAKKRRNTSLKTMVNILFAWAMVSLAIEALLIPYAIDEMDNIHVENIKGTTDLHLKTFIVENLCALEKLTVPRELFKYGAYFLGLNICYRSAEILAHLGSSKHNLDDLTGVKNKKIKYKEYHHVPDVMTRTALNLFSIPLGLILMFTSYHNFEKSIGKPSEFQLEESGWHIIGSIWVPFLLMMIMNEQVTKDGLSKGLVWSLEQVKDWWNGKYSYDTYDDGIGFGSEIGYL